MDKLNASKINDKFQELQEERRKILEQSYFLFFGTSIISAIFVSLLRPNPSLQNKLLMTFLSTLIMVIVYSIMSYSIKKVKNIRRFDWIVFSLALIFYITAIIFSPVQRILASIIVYPALVMLVFSTMNQLKVTLFFAVHGVIVLAYFLINPALEVVITAHNYVTLATIIIVMFVVMVRLIRLFNNYQKNISDDYKELNEKNMELHALNEEYYATQEELFEQYEEVTKLNDLNKKLAFFDDLTGVHNRNGFNRYIDSMIERRESDNHIVYIDIERFKDINSVYGYHIGDVIIQQMTKRIQDISGQIKEVARIGGDLFAFVIGSDIELEAFLESLQALNMEMTVEESAIAIRINVGILLEIDLSLSPDVMLQQVDTALNKAKQNQDFCYYVFDEKLHEQISRRVKMTQALEKAIDKKEVMAVFQPIVNASSGRVVAFEALARWQCAEFGFVSPSEFIPLAEKANLISGLTREILIQVCTFIKDKNVGKWCFVSVNISGSELRKADLAHWLTSIVDDYGVPHESIGFEVTETGLIERFEVAAKHLETLRKEGFSIYLDDFGVGYSSLNYMERLPIDVLKIDRSFITDIHLSTKKQQMVQMMTHLAKDLNLKTVAEGVEIEEEFELLKSYGIDRIQGYYFYKPMKLEELKNQDDLCYQVEENLLL